MADRNHRMEGDEHMKFVPYKYQKYAIQFIIDHPIAAIFLDCGMGKTGITLMAILALMYDYFEVGKVLIVAPKRVAKHTWVDEINKFEDFGVFTYSVVVGTAAERMAALKADADIYITNRESLPWIIEESGMPVIWDMIVLDELSSFKNYACKRFKALMKIRPKVRRIVGLTGTPTGSGGYMDLFGEYKALDMGQRLGRFIGQYRSAYFRPLATNGQIVYSYGLLPGAQEMINRKISDITISMSAVDHLDMPEKIETVYPVYLDEEERRTYESMKDNLIIQTEEGEVTASNAGVLSSKLCQLAAGAIYSDDGVVAEVHGRKLDAVEDIVESMLGRPLMIVYFFRHDADRLAERLTSMKASFDFIDSDGSIERWNRGELSVCLLHPMSAGFGLNLQESGCNTILFFSTPWSVEAVSQTVARLYRIGQKHCTVTVMHIVTKDTIDERIMKAVSDGNTTQAALVDAVKAEF